MARLQVNDRLPEFRVLTKDGTFSIKELVDRNTMLIFLRYLGCTMCQYELWLLMENNKKFIEAGGQIIVFLQSSLETLSEETFPFTVVSDENRKIYELLDIRAAERKEELRGEKREKLDPVIKSMGFEHGKYEGEELQLPAAFAVDKELNVYYTKYGVEVADIPEVAEIIELLAQKRC